MEKLENKLQEISSKYREVYQSEYDNSDGLNAKANNGETFNKIYGEFVNEIIATANTYIGENPSIVQGDVEALLQKMTLRFSSIMLNPFN